MGEQLYVFDARLEGCKGVRRRIAVRGDQTLVDLHEALRDAFGWQEEHLFSFWLSGKFWARDGSEYTHPFALASDAFAGWDLPIARPARKSAECALGGLRLTKGQRIAYLFDFGDEWRVRLTVRESGTADGGAYPRIVQSVGVAPPQYPVEDAQDAA
jgi:hypothetical protein